MVDLYEHNQKAYESSVAMLGENKKAAIIHPTGTGKSFIGFKYCEEHPDQVVCWLSPSAYIFETQVENWQKAGGEELKNIRFFTYAKLMRMTLDESAKAEVSGRQLQGEARSHQHVTSTEESEDSGSGFITKEIEAIHPDLILLDEFHRAGAEFWGQGVNHLLSVYPDVPILGLSATAIRYLDNQRDMAAELFDGNIASEMTLGESIVRGILNAPTYVLALFSYQKELEKYEEKVKRIKNKAVVDEAQKYLEALRRTLNQAEGLEEIFAKNMTVPHGKYLVFCSNKEHMDEMMIYAKDWFVKVDPKPQIYSLYANDPSSDKAFKDFKADDSDHLRLLYCIDALNEGIHVDGINGVILLRPTVSPIIYKQQIGRALSAGGDQSAVIFDIVMNIENLYSISAIEEEMAEARAYFLGLGEDSLIVNEKFKILDSLQDCRLLFEQLEAALSASWDRMFELCKAYVQKNGDLLIPKAYHTEEGYPLGNWLLMQRRIRSGKIQGRLTDEQIEKLDRIGMVWGNVNLFRFDQNFEAAKAYRQQQGDLNIPANYKTDEGFALGNWIRNLRQARKIGSTFLTAEQIEKLDAIGMVWDVQGERFKDYYYACKQYKENYGDLDVPKDYITKDRLAIGKWLDQQRYAYQKQGRSKKEGITQEEIDALNALGMIWETRRDQRWTEGYREAKAYYEAFGNLDCPQSFKTASGYPLGKWLSQQRAVKNLSEKKKNLLTEIGMVFEKPDSWTKHYLLAKAWYDEHGSIEKMPQNEIVGKVWLGRWIREQKLIIQGKRKGKNLTEEQIEKLNAIGMVWEDQKDRTWNRNFEQAKAYYEKYGTLSFKKKGDLTDTKKLSSWLTGQRSAFHEGKLTKEQEMRLRSIGMVFDDSWEIGFSHAKDYVKKYKKMLIPNNFIAEDGFKLGLWIRNQRSIYRGNYSDRSLSDEQIARLDAIGMIWDVPKYQWQIGFEALEDYLKVNPELPKAHYVTDDGFKLGSWVRTQRMAFEKGKLSPDRLRLLKKAGYVLK